MKHYLSEHIIFLRGFCLDCKQFVKSLTSKPSDVKKHCESHSFDSHKKHLSFQRHLDIASNADFDEKNGLFLNMGPGKICSVCHKTKGEQPHFECFYKQRGGTQNDVIDTAAETANLPAPQRRKSREAEEVDDWSINKTTK